jgi:hypothetical protein
MRMPPSPTTHLRVALSVTVAGVTALILAGCSHSPATMDAAGQSVTQSRSPAAVPASAPSGVGPGKPVNVCMIINAATATRLTGQTITTAVARTGLMPKEYGCAYANDDDSLQVEVTVFEHDAASSYGVFSAGSKNASPVSGLGDKAFYDNDGTLYALAGINLIQVNGLDSASECAALARPVLAAL